MTMWSKKSDFLICNRFCKLTGLKNDEDEMLFQFYEIKDGKHTDTRVDFGTTILGTLSDMYISSHETEWITYTNYNFVFEDDDGYFKLGFILNKPARKLINKLVNADLSCELEISVWNSIYEIETKEKKIIEKTSKNLTVKQKWVVVPGRMENAEMKAQTKMINDAKWNFVKTDFSLLDDIMLDMFKELQGKLKELNTPKTVEETRAEVEVDVDEKKPGTPVWSKGKSLKDLAEEDPDWMPF